MVVKSQIRTFGHLCDKRKKITIKYIGMVKILKISGIDSSFCLLPFELNALSKFNSFLDLDTQAKVYRKCCITDANDVLVICRNTGLFRCAYNRKRAVEDDSMRRTASSTVDGSL